MNIVPVILCGGAGTRLWPASRPLRPKQFIDLVSELSLFQDTARRVAPLARDGRIVVVAGIDHRQYIEAQLAALSIEGELILEPTGRDSAPAMAAAALWIERIDPEAIAIFVASDHYVPDPAAFRRVMEEAVAAAAPGRIVTLGITPASPSSAYGYIQPAEPGLSPVARFVEKPDQAEAERYLAAGYFWNSGNFVAPVRTLLAELRRFAPEVVGSVDAALPHVTAGRIHRLGEAFSASTKISIDYAVMEKSDKVWVIPAPFEWSDLGAWDAVAATGSGARGVWVDQASDGCLVRAAPGMVVATAGVSNLAIIAEPDAVLVCDLNRAQDVKSLVEQLARRKVGMPDAIAPSLSELSDRLGRWLKLNALPLWATLGVEADGAFAETLDDAGVVGGDFRRARVQARQAYVYSLASIWGWGQGYAALVERGLARFEVTNRREDSLYRTQVTRAGAVLDDTASLYDQAFVLLATATAASAGVDLERCRRTAAAVQAALATMALPQGGWREPAGPAFQANAHMHLLEASLAWEALEPDGPWAAMADTVVGMARAHFIDDGGGYLREFFGPDWRPAEGEAGRLVEPGHQFEWAWLLARWGRLRSDPWALEAARRLFAAGEHGLDPARGVTIDELDESLQLRSARARLWPQTEWLKAALILAEEAEEAEGVERKRLLDSAGAALRGLWLYLAPSGLWHDKLGADGVFETEPAPASSLYHIVAAYRQLRETAGRLART